MARGNRRRRKVATVTTGRNIRTVKYVAGKNRLAALPTILNTIRSGNYDLRRRRLTVRDDNLVGWDRTENESLTLILLVDVSKSTWAFIEVFKEILRSLTDYFNRHKDRIGLIALQGEQAVIYCHPTHNFRVVARGLGRLKFHGMTPLADGLFKSLSMARLEKSKSPGSRCTVILLSDCYPEPLLPGYDDVFDDPAYRRSINVAATYRKAQTMLLVINPTFSSPEGVLPGEILSKRLAQASGGRLIKFFRPRDARHRPPSRRELDIILQGIEESLAQ
jgi:Mg-chelatase subunit ChlD